MQIERRKIIQFAMNYDIDDINTYAGYKGDLILKIVSKDIDAIAEIQKFANTLNILDGVVKHNPNLLHYEVFCVTKDKDTYEIKQESLKKDKEHSIHDVWSNVSRED
jgi:hypothetical protein